MTQFGVCVFDGDPVGGLAALGLPPAVLFGDRSFAEVLRLAGRSAHLAGELAGKSPVALAGLGFYAWAEPELFSDALGAHRGLVVRPARPHRPAPQGASLAVADGGGLDRVLCALAGDEGDRPGRPAFGRRTWVSAPSTRSVTFSAAAQAHTSARVRRRRPGRCGTANPRPASSGLISPIARPIVEDPT